MIGTGGNFYCEICNPFQYAASIMGVEAQRTTHIKDATDFFDALENGNLPAVSYLRPDSFDDGHPASSKLNPLEALIQRVLDKLQAHPDLFDTTVVFITFDEGGGNRIGQLAGGEGRWLRMLRLLAFAAWFIAMLVAGWLFSVAP